MWLLCKIAPTVIGLSIGAAFCLYDYCPVPEICDLTQVSGPLCDAFSLDQKPSPNLVVGLGIIIAVLSANILRYRFRKSSQLRSNGRSGFFEDQSDRCYNDSYSHYDESPIESLMDTISDLGFDCHSSNREQESSSNLFEKVD